MTDAERAVSEAWALARDGQSDEALARLPQLTTDRPDSAVAWFELGGMLDWLGREEEALQPYERAHVLGLSAELQGQWALQYGSTLRNVAASTTRSRSCAMPSDDTRTIRPWISCWPYACWMRATRQRPPSKRSARA